MSNIFFFRLFFIYSLFSKQKQTIYSLELWKVSHLQENKDMKNG